VYRTVRPQKKGDMDMQARVAGTPRGVKSGVSSVDGAHSQHSARETSAPVRLVKLSSTLPGH